LTHLRLLFCVSQTNEFAPTEAWAEFLANPTGRTNFVTRLKLCTQAAACLLDMNAKVEMDGKKGTIVISGPAVVEAFGAEPIWLDEKEASYTALAAIAADRRNVVAKRGSNTRGVRAVVSPDSELEHVCKVLIQCMKRCKGKPSKRQTSALGAVSLAISEVLRTESKAAR
jgi:hypothetical protein